MAWPLGHGRRRLHDQASHYVDMVDWLVGPVDNVHAYTATLARNIEAEDTGVMSLRLRSGALASINVTMLTHNKNFEGSITLLGERGTVRVGVSPSTRSSTGSSMRARGRRESCRRELRRRECLRPRPPALLRQRDQDAGAARRTPRSTVTKDALARSAGRCLPFGARRCARRPAAGVLMAVQVHPSAIVDAGAQIGDGTRVWHFVARQRRGAHRSETARSGRRLRRQRRRDRDNVKIQNNVSVYDAVTPEDDVFCGPSMVFTNVLNRARPSFASTSTAHGWVGAGDAGGELHDRPAARPIGRHAFIGAGAVVTQSADFALVAGVPARQIGWMSRHGERLDLPLTGDGDAVWTPPASLICCVPACAVCVTSVSVSTKRVRRLKSQYAALKDALANACSAWLDHGQYIMGPEVVELEQRLAAYTGREALHHGRERTEALLFR